MALVRDFCSQTGKANTITLNWRAPVGLNTTDKEIIVTKTTTHYPVELYNTSFPTKATDSRPIEIYRGKTIAGIDTGTISVSSNTITDTAASFPNLKGRLVRDSLSQVFRISSNTTTSFTIEPIIDVTFTNGKYIILPDFSTTTRIQDNFEFDIRTTAESGNIYNLVYVLNGILTVRAFETDELANLIFIDANNDKFIIKNNTANKIYFFESTLTPAIGAGMKILQSHANTTPLPYIDNFLTEAEAIARTGTGLRDDKYYYYTVFTLGETSNVAQAEFGFKDSNFSTQDFAMSPAEKLFGERLFDLWPGVYKDLDSTGDLEDLMQVFGFFFDELHAVIKTFNLQDPDNVVVTALLPLSEQTGLPSVGFSIGADTLRRIAKDMLSCWKMKGTKEGITTFIRKITTWDITNGTGDISGAIQDTLPNVSALRFFDINLGSANVRLTQSSPLFVPGGRFAKGLPGVIIPGFFSFREFVITVSEVALFIGNSENYTTSQNTTTMVDSLASFGSTNSLVGNFFMPNQEEVNDIFQIVSNTATTITVKGIINNRNIGGNYAILSPLNTNRFIILNKLLPFYIPYGTSAGFIFI